MECIQDFIQCFFDMPKSDRVNLDIRVSVEPNSALNNTTPRLNSRGVNLDLIYGIGQLCALLVAVGKPSSWHKQAAP